VNNAARMTAPMVVPTVTSSSMTTIALPSLLRDGIRNSTIFADPPWPERCGGKI
jgi:hypothetical protein